MSIENNIQKQLKNNRIKFVLYVWIKPIIKPINARNCYKLILLIGLIWSNLINLNR